MHFLHLLLLYRFIPSHQSFSPMHTYYFLTLLWNETISSLTHLLTFFISIFLFKFKLYFLTLSSSLEYFSRSHLDIQSFLCALLSSVCFFLVLFELLLLFTTQFMSYYICKKTFNTISNVSYPLFTSSSPSLFSLT